LILVTALFLLDGERREKERKEKRKEKKMQWGMRVSPGWTHCWLCSGFQLLGAIKG
jgi:hypothetical protein